MVFVQHRRRHIPERPQPRNLIIHDREFLENDAIVFHSLNKSSGTLRVNLEDSAQECGRDLQLAEAVRCAKNSDWINDA